MAWKLSLWFLIEWSRLKFLQCWKYFIELHLNVCIKWDQFDGFLISFSANLFLELFMEARLLDLGAYFHQTHKLAQMRILISKSRTKVYGNERNASWVSPHFRVILSEASLNKIPQRYEAIKFEFRFDEFYLFYLKSSFQITCALPLNEICSCFWYLSVT